MAGKSKIQKTPSDKLEKYLRRLNDQKKELLNEVKSKITSEEVFSSPFCEDPINSNDVNESNFQDVVNNNSKFWKSAVANTSTYDTPSDEAYYSMFLQSIVAYFINHPNLDLITGLIKDINNTLSVSLEQKSAPSDCLDKICNHCWEYLNSLQNLASTIAEGKSSDDDCRDACDALGVISSKGKPAGPTLKNDQIEVTNYFNQVNLLVKHLSNKNVPSSVKRILISDDLTLLTYFKGEEDLETITGIIPNAVKYILNEELNTIGFQIPDITIEDTEHKLELALRAYTINSVKQIEEILSLNHFTDEADEESEKQHDSVISDTESISTPVITRSFINNTPPVKQATNDNSQSKRSEHRSSSDDDSEQFGTGRVNAHKWQTHQHYDDDNSQASDEQSHKQTETQEDNIIPQSKEMTIRYHHTKGDLISLIIKEVYELMKSRDSKEFLAHETVRNEGFISHDTDDLVIDTVEYEEHIIRTCFRPNAVRFLLTLESSTNELYIYQLYNSHWTDVS
jgi:hypothetical protein